MMDRVGSLQMNALPFPAFAALALDCYRPPLRAASTLGRMKSILARLDALEVRSTADLTTSLIVRFVADRAAAVRINTLIGELGYLSALCSLAVSEGALERSPFAGAGAKRFRLRAEPPALKRWHPVADVARALRSMRERSGDSWGAHRLYAAAAVVAYTGLRRSEALNLHVADYDATARLLLVVARRRLKTAAAAQPVPAPAELVEALEGWIPRAGSVWMFPNQRRSGPWSGGSPGYRPVDQLKAAGLVVGVEGLTWQSLRHSWATAAEGPWGLGEGQIQRVLRHTRPMTSRGYRHADVANLAAIGARVSLEG